MPKNIISKLESALTLVKMGFAVFPVHTPQSDGSCSCGKQDCGNNGKHPRTSNGVKDATTELAKIQAWWHKWPNTNIGLATGNGFVVLDVDPRHGGDESLRLLEAKHGALPHTIRSLTGGGGEHIFFQTPEDTHIGNRTEFQPGLDIRGSGGYIVAPPSVHASGNSYEWEVTSHPDEVEMAVIPDWLLSLIQKQPVKEVITSDAPEIIKEGVRNVTLFQLASSLRSKGLPAKTIEECLQALNRNHCTPTVSDGELQNIVKSVCKYDKPSIAKPGLGVLPQGISAKELMAKSYPPINWIIPGALLQGMCLFVGGSKIGKSWLALSLALAVAAGEVFWDNEPLPQSPVLYIALEDYEQGLQIRLTELLEGKDAPDDLYFYFDFPRLDSAGKQLLIELIEKHSNCKLVVIDTLGRSRPNNSSRQNIYDADIEMLGDLQKMAVEKGICLMFLHHTRKDKKMQSGDPFEEISGSTGLMGTADTTWLLHRPRGEQTAILRITGRGVQDQEIHLRFENCRWAKTDPSSPKLNETAQKILECFTDESTTLTPKQVTEIIKLNHDTVKQAMGRMVTGGSLVKLEKGLYKKFVTLSPNPENSRPDDNSAVTVKMSPTTNVTQDEMEEYLAIHEGNTVTYDPTEDVTYEYTDYESLDD